jgi:AcrR family transcriptional regulator
MPTRAPLPLPARQDRSRRTLGGILDAAEALLEDQLFDDLTVAAIARRAGCAVGTVYARLPNKEALLPSLFARYRDQFLAGVRDLVQAEDVRRLALAGRVAAVTTFLVKNYRRRRGLLRALAAQSIARSGVVTEPFRAAMTTAFRQLGKLLALRPSEIAHPSPAAAVQLGLLTVAATAQNRILFGTVSAVAFAVDDRRLTRELARLLLAYLTCPGAPFAEDFAS